MCNDYESYLRILRLLARQGIVYLLQWGASLLATTLFRSIKFTHLFKEKTMKRDTIIIHCSATREGQDISTDTIRKWHLDRGFWDIGYHYVIRLDGTIEAGRDVHVDGAHCMGWNQRSIGVCYVGGLDAQGKPADTRTPAQKESLRTLVAALRITFPKVTQVIGHRDTSPDLDGNGIITPNEYVKACPCFDVKTEM